MVYLGYGALLARSMAAPENVPVRKLGSITCGIGLLFILVAGFGLVAKLGYNYTETWILVKFAIWLLLGGLIVLINRKTTACYATMVPAHCIRCHRSDYGLCRTLLGT